MTLPPSPHSIVADDAEPPIIDLRRPITHTIQIIDLAGPTVPFTPIPNDEGFEIEDIYSDDDEGSGYDSDETIPYVSLESICQACEVYKRTVVAHARLIECCAEPPAPESVLNVPIRMLLEFGDFPILRSLRTLNLGEEISQSLALSLFSALQKHEERLMRFIRSNPGIRAQFTRRNWRRLTEDLRPRTRGRDDESSDEEDRRRPRRRRRFT